MHLRADFRSDVALARMNSEQPREKQSKMCISSSEKKKKKDNQTFTGIFLVKERPHSCCQKQLQTEGEAV